MHLHEFFAMGGYAAYVWPAYGITFSVFVINLVTSWKTAKRTRLSIKNYLANEQ